MARKNAQAELEIRLLGDPDVRRGTSRVTSFDSARLQSLLGYLIVGRGGPVPRQRLAFELWPDSTDGQARTNLRQALHHLRHALVEADRYLRMDGRTVQWVADGPAAVDVVGFQADADAGLRGDEEALSRAADAYRGDLLPGCYDAWLTPERDRLRALAGRVFVALVGAARQRQDWPCAVEAAERLVRLDPIDEASHRLLIEIHAAAGDRVRAVRRYHECVAVLDRELGVGPDPRTVAIYDELMVGGSSTRPAEPRAPGTDRLPLIGREDQLGALTDAWSDTASGRCRFVLVAGEPGIGKSRLVEELLTTCRREGATVVATRAYEAQGAGSYGPVMDILRAEGMGASVRSLDLRMRRELARVLPETIDGDDAVAAPDGDRQLLFKAISQVLVAPARRLVLGIDDLHWCDADTFDLLEVVLRSATAAATPMLVVATIREEELASRPPLRAAVSRLHTAAGAAGEVSLGRLDSTAARRLVDTILDPTSWAHAPVDRLISAADGNPLFLVEMARSGLFGGCDGSSTFELPPRVHAVIDMRLARLSEPARELVAVAAVVGRSFTIDLLARLLRDEELTVAALDELWRRGIVRERGVDSYDFSHDRIRDVAYHRIPPARRRSHHAGIARALGDLGSCEPRQIAYHLDRAGHVDAAISAYLDAVHAAVRAYAHQDVIATCRRALELVATRRAGPERDDVELDLLVPLGVAIMAGPGVRRDDREVYERARALRARRGLAAEASTLRLSANAAMVHREYRTARRYGDELLQRGRSEDDGVLLTEGHYLLGVTAFWLGDLESASRSLRESLRAYRPDRIAVHLEHFGQDARSVCLARLGLTAHHLGDTWAAADHCERALQTAAELGHEYTDLYVRMFVAWYLADAGRADAAADLANRMPTAAHNPMASIARAQFTGWAHTTRGDPVAGVRLLTEAARVAHVENPMFEPSVLMHLARSRLAAGDVAGARTDVAAALAIAATESPFHLPEASRLSGELELAGEGDADLAVAHLRAAIDAATSSGALVEELRARTSLLRALRTHAPSAVAAEVSSLEARCVDVVASSPLDAVTAAHRELASCRLGRRPRR